VSNNQPPETGDCKKEEKIWKKDEKTDWKEEKVVKGWEDAFKKVEKSSMI